MLKYQWTDGSSPTRSIRQKIQSQQNSNEIKQIASSVVDPCMMNSPPQILLHSPGYFSNMDENGPQREDTHFKIAQRDMMAQTGQNPFFSYNNSSVSSYADQVSIQDKFLKPLSTIHTDKSKTNVSNDNLQEPQQFQ